MRQQQLALRRLIARSMMRRYILEMNEEERALTDATVDFTRPELRRLDIVLFHEYIRHMFKPAQRGDKASYANAHLEGRELAMALNNFLIVEVLHTDINNRRHRSAVIFTPNGDSLVCKLSQQSLSNYYLVRQSFTPF